MAHKFQQSELCNFEEGNEIIEGLPEKYRHAQARLYEVTNPYVGNKRGIITEIARSLDENNIKWDSVFDLFSGSAVVSIFAKLVGKEVISNDILTSSYYSSLAFVENQKLTISQNEIRFLCDNRNPGRGTFVTDNYNTRFTLEEAAFLDNYRANVDTLLSKEFDHRLEGPNTEEIQREKEIKEALCIVMIEHYVINRCFVGGRLNSGQILAKLEHRVNHARSGGDPNADKMQFSLNPPPQFFTEASRTYLGLNRDAIEALQNINRSTDLLYIDPPYGSDQSDYAYMFAFCEEYIYGKFLSQLPHLNNAHKFTKSKDYQDHFDEVLSHSNCANTLAISYNNSSFADLKTIKGIISKHRKQITVVNISHRYKYRSEENAKGTEYLIIAR